MKIKYEKHQRDYTSLGTSQVAREFYSKRMINYFSFTPHPFYFLVEDGALYHYIQSKDYEDWSNAWAKKYSYKDLQKFIKETNKLLLSYRKFLNKKHADILAALQDLHYYMRILTPSVVVTAYVPLYCENIDKRIIDLCLKYRQKNDNAHKLGMTLQKKLLNRLEKKLHIQKDILQYLTDAEFNKFVLFEKLPKGLSKRKYFVFIEETPKGEKIIEKKKALIKLKEIDITRKKISVSEINGSTAYPGKAQGKVKIIRLVKDAQKVKKGDILVASMTDPRYVPVMKRSGAIITDEGGITCHAAIVSRELKKPCVVGTKIATQVLKDGDLVEVDADKGAVKILKG